MRISRPCYDKMHRCPGWAGGGSHYAKIQRCDNGSLAADLYSKRAWKWRFNQCPKCGVHVLPYMTRWLDYGWWTWKIRAWKSDLDYWRYLRRLEKTARESEEDHDYR